MLFRRISNTHTFDCFGRSGTNNFRYSIQGLPKHKPIKIETDKFIDDNLNWDTSCKSRSSNLARNENENPQNPSHKYPHAFGFLVKKNPLLMEFQKAARSIGMDISWKHPMFSTNQLNWNW